MPKLATKVTGSPLRKNKDYIHQKPWRFLTPAELTRLKEALTSQPSPATSPYSLAAIWMLLLTGCRLSELLALTWEDVDLKNGCFYLKDSKVGPRIVPLSDKAKQILVSLQRQEGNPYAFCGKLPGTRLTGISKVWQHVSALAGIPDVHIRDLRHSFASFCLSQGKEGNE